MSKNKLVYPRRPKVARPTLTCSRCGWIWFPRGDKLPGTCASRTCKSPYWNKARVRNIKVPMIRVKLPTILKKARKKTATKRVKAAA